jgi:hypothetical protein
MTPAKLQAPDRRACFASSAFTALNVLPQGLLMAPIDAAPYVLALTPHSVIAGPYHRDNHGNRLALDVFLGTPDKARELLEGSGAKYLIACPAADELALLGERAPGGMAHLLSKNKAPAWLVPVAVPGTPYRVFEIH